MTPGPAIPDAHPAIKAREVARREYLSERDGVWLEGFVSPIGETVRLYQSPEADRYIEVSREAVIDIEEAEEPEGWVRVRLSASTPVTLITRREATFTAGEVESRFRTIMLLAQSRADDDDEPPPDPRQCIFDCITAKGPPGETDHERFLRETRCMSRCRDGIFGHSGSVFA